MLAYKVMSEEEAEQERFSLMPEGEYDAIITSSEDKMSSSGNSMMDMMLTVYDKAGVQHSVRDFLVLTPKMMWKTIQCAGSAGLMPQYQAGKFCSNAVINRNVRVKIGIEEGKPIPPEKLGNREPGATYPAKNKVVGYVKPGTVTVMPIQTRESKAAEEIDNDVPF